MEKNDNNMEKLLYNIIYGGEQQKEEALRTLCEHPVTTIPFDSLKLDELMALLDEYPVSINDWEGNLKDVIVRKCKEASKDEIRNAICTSNNRRAHKTAIEVYEERFDPSSPHYLGDTNEEDEEE